MITKITNNKEYRQCIDELREINIIHLNVIDDELWQRKCKLEHMIDSYEDELIEFDNIAIDKQKKQSILFKIFDWVMRL